MDKASSSTREHGKSIRGKTVMPERSVRSILRRRRLGPEIVTAHSDETVREAAVRMAQNCRASILVVEDDRVLGIFTERDVLVRVVGAGRDPARTRLREVMTTDLETIGADEPIAEAVRRMDEGGIRHLPVVEGSQVLGVLSSRDIPILALGRMAEELNERHRLAERAW
jgi:CBS domain-containing protein